MTEADEGIGVAPEIGGVAMFGGWNGGEAPGANGGNPGGGRRMPGGGGNPPGGIIPIGCAPGNPAGGRKGGALIKEMKIRKWAREKQE